MSAAKALQIAVGERAVSGLLQLPPDAWACYVVAQTIGGCIGTIVANVMFELPIVELSTRDRSSNPAEGTAGINSTFEGKRRCLKSEKNMALMSSVLPRENSATNAIVRRSE